MHINVDSNLEPSSSSEDSDVLMIDPFLDYINGILMDEAADDATYLQQVDGASCSSYQAIFRSLQDIIADSPPVSPVIQYDAAYLQQVEGTPNYQAIFSSLQDIIRADSASTSHRQSKSQRLQADNSLSMHSRITMAEAKLPCEDENCRYNVCSSLNCDEEALSQSYRSAIGLNGGLLTNVAIVSCPGKLDVPAQGHIGEKHGDEGTFMLPSAYKRSSSELAELDVSFEDLKLDDVYTSLYVDEEHSCSANRRHKQKSLGTGKGMVGENHTSEAPVFVDVRDALLSCAQAVAKGNSSRANQILQELHQVYGASVHGTGLQRMTYIFSKALAARMRGTGVHELKAMTRDMPSSAAVLRAAKFEFEVIPYIKLEHYFANQSILQAARGASRLHIVDYGLVYGLQWPCLINALANRKGAPPLLFITFIESPQPGVDMVKRYDESGRRLAAYAKTYNVPFQYHVIVTDKWEDVDAASLLCSEAEVLVVNCLKRLRHLADDSTPFASRISARQKLLTFWHSLNPHLLVTAVVNAAHNSPFFVTRFREALNFYSNVFDMLDELGGDIPERLTIERNFYYHSIMNVVACEGAERVERPETYKQWHLLIAKAGFRQLLIPAATLARSKSHVKQHYHKDFLIHDDAKGWMLLGWKGRALIAISTWRPISTV